MKKIALAAAALALGTVSASAADMAARYYTKAPVAVAAVYNWTGFYIGAQAGGILRKHRRGVGSVPGRNKPGLFV